MVIDMKSLMKDKLCCVLNPSKECALCGEKWCVDCWAAKPLPHSKDPEIVFYPYCPKFDKLLTAAKPPHYYLEPQED